MKIKLLAIAFIIIFSSVTFAAEYKVAMKNSGADGIMVFEPAVLKVNIGDTVHFIPTDMAHNSESVEGLTPQGAVTWRGAMNQKVSVTLDKEGVYVYQCLPHAMLAMVGVIVAGEATNLGQIKAKATDYSARFATNKDRLDKYLLSLQ